MDIRDKVIVIIGSEGLLGKEIADHLIAMKSKVVKSDLSIKDTSENDSELIMNVNITSEQSLQNLFKKTLDKFDSIDCLINVAYPKTNNFGQDLQSVSYDDFCESINLHLGGYFLASKVFAENFLTLGQGNIINFSSIYGSISPKFEIYENSTFGMPIEYAAIKSALIHMTKYFAKYYSGKNIRFNTISPGGIFDNHEESFAKLYAYHCLNKGMLDPKDILGLVEFLISDNSRYLNGQDIILDDGFTL